MTSSGVALNDEVLHCYESIKTGRKHKYAMFGLNEKQSEIICKVRGPKDGTYDDFCSELQDDVPMYAVIDYDYVDKNNINNSKIFFVNWCPDTSKVKVKMVHSASKDVLKTKLLGVFAELQVNDREALGREYFRAKLLAHGLVES